MIDLKPSQVFLAHVPLVGTMRKAESEFAAAILVRVCQAKGDAWQQVTPAMIGDVIGADLAAGAQPMTGWNRNPFFRPDFYRLVAGGFARWCGEVGKGPLELTDAGLEALRSWVRPAQPTSAAEVAAS